MRGCSRIRYRIANRAIVTDLHAQATYLVRSKYRRLVVAYATFLAGFAIAALVLVFTLTLD